MANYYEIIITNELLKLSPSDLKLHIEKEVKEIKRFYSKLDKLEKLIDCDNPNKKRIIEVRDSCYRLIDTTKLDFIKRFRDVIEIMTAGMK